MTTGPLLPDVVRLAAGTLPDLERLAQKAIRRLVAQSPELLRCRHVAAPRAAGACCEHPAAGLMCRACCESHIDRHSHQVEHRCDRCGHQGDAMRSISGVQDLVVVTINTAGQKSLYIGPVTLGCLGLCGPCADDAGLPAEVAS